MKRLTEYEIIAGHVHAVPTDDADKAMMSLAAYEDTGLEPEAVRRLIQDWTSLIMTLDELGGMPHLRELVQAEQDGRLVVLPFPQNKPLLDMSNPENPELLVNFRVAIAYNHCGIVFHQPFNIFMENVERGYICQVSEEAEAALAKKGDSEQ